MNLDLLRQELIRYEGYKITVYLDTVGLPTVGIGHMDRKLIVGTLYTPKQINDFYEQDVENAIVTASKHVNINILDNVRARVMVQLAFNLGNKLGQFKKFLAAVAALDWDLASKELQDSKWYTQVGRRGPETCYAIVHGKYEWQ